ncbi:MAG: DinB family protein [Melioribacteraceae bacterium]
MLKDTLVELFERDLNKLIEEIKLYKNESDLWIKQGSISNPAGNLALHLAGNLNHFIGFALGNTGYKRERDSEFSSVMVPRDELLISLERTKSVVKNSLLNLKTEDFEKPFPIKKQDEIFSTNYMLLHLLAHLSYHLGQINYHRRLIQRESL